MHKHIFLVEDNYFLHDMYRRAFEKAGYVVTVAEDGKQATEKESPAYDLILLDIMLPTLPGNALVKRWREPGSPMQHTPIIILTNLKQNDIIDQMFEDGADGYVLKADITPQQLVEEIGKILASHN